MAGLAVAAVGLAEISPAAVVIVVVVVVVPALIPAASTTYFPLQPSEPCDPLEYPCFLHDVPLPH